jgi:DNA primase small subunit
MSQQPASKKPKRVAKRKNKQPQQASVSTEKADEGNPHMKTDETEQAEKAAIHQDTNVESKSAQTNTKPQPETKTETTKTTSSLTVAYDFGTLIKTYWGSLFPAKQICQVLAPRNQKLEMREFSFDVQIGNSGATTYSRYNSYTTPADLRKGLIKSNALRVDLGAVYTVPPRDRGVVASKVAVAVEKELVFDVDMTDYNDVRRCCSGADICHKCWPLMNIAIKVLDHILKEDFGFKCIGWVYSGRRGVHCWVWDPRARRLTLESRSSIVEYLSVASQVKKAADADRKDETAGPPMPSYVILPMHLHPSLKWAYEEILLPAFEGGLFPEFMFETEQGMASLLSAPGIPDEIRQEVLQYWQGDGAELTPIAKWEGLRDLINDCMQGNVKKEGKVVKVGGTNPLYNIVFTFTYPRLDINVSKHLNHLLKSPFCVHPATGRVCVPIDPARCDDFDPLAVPTLERLLQEIDEFDKHAPKPPPTTDSTQPAQRQKTLKAYKKTSLKEYVKLFEREVVKPLTALLNDDAKNKSTMDF